jgi:putative ABC transport system permease protein
MKGQSRYRPPRPAERLLAASIRDHAWRDSIVGDLREEFADLSSRTSRPAARRWYWRQALSIGGRGLASRLGAVRLSRDSWLTAAEPDMTASWRVGLTRDCRHAWRALSRRPATSAVIVLTLALTLAVNSTVFALLDALLLRPYRFPTVDRLAVVMSASPQDPIPDGESVAPADFREWRSEVRTLRYLSAAGWWDANLSGIDTPQQVPGYRVTADFFDALGVPLALGRDFVRDEETPGQHRRAILGHQLWERQFAANPDVVGQTVRVDGEPYVVVGIAPPRFAIPDGAQIWAPLAYSTEEWNQRRRGYLRVFGQLADGASLEQARAEVTALVERQQRDHPETNGSRPVTVVDFQRGMADPGAGPFIGTVQAAALLLMLIACANIANLLLARGTERTQEYGVRLALGAGRGRLAWQMFLEGGALAAIAVVLALPLAWALIGASRASIPEAVIRFIPGFQYIQVSPLLFAAMALTAAGATLLFALLPAVHAARAGASDGLRQGARSFTASRRRHWIRSALATSQLALTLALLFGSVLALAAANRAIDGVFGFDKRNLLVARLMLPERAYADPEHRRQFITTVLDRMHAIPAVSEAAMISNLPYAGGNATLEFWPEGVLLKTRDVRYVDYRRASASYLSTMRIPLVSGRWFDAGDRAETQAVAVVSRSLADRYWPNEDPVGRRFKLKANGDWITIVGVAGDVLHDWFQQRRAPTVYRPLSQDAPYAHAFVVRTIGEPTSVAGDLRRAVASADADQPLIDVKSMEKHIADRTAGITFVARALGFVAVIAFVFAITGLYSLMAFIGSRRTQEIGVRIALGAGWWHVIRLATAQAVRITAVGIIAGAVMAAALGRVMESVLAAGISSSLWYLAGLIVLLTVVALTAAYFPARRAAAIDPTIALRAE